MKTVKKTATRGRKIAGNAVSMWTKLRYHYGWHFKYSPIQDNAILFESFHGKTMSDSPLHMLRAFVADPRSKDFKIYYTTTLENLKSHRMLAESLDLEVEFVCIESWKYVKVLATAKYLVNNSSFPVYFTRRPEQRYIQTWHGTPLKTLGKQMRQGIESMYNVQHNFLQANVLTFPNEFTRDVMMRDYNLTDLYTGKVALLGYPRNGVFFDTAKAQEVKRRHGLEHMETFAYMPTWRGANNYTVDIVNYRDQVMSYLRKVDAVLCDDQAMFVNFHSMVASKITLDSFDHIFPFPADEDNYEFLNAMDVLITDYSSVFFDFSLTRKPIILFIYDKDAYISERGMYLDIETLPFPKMRTIDELVEAISKGTYKTSSYENTDYERDFLSYDSADNARKALDLLFNDAADGVDLDDYTRNSSRHWQTIDPLHQTSVADVRAACEAARPEKDIVMFSKSSFNEDKSKLLHDEYRDKFNFVFVTKARTCTAIEEIMGKRTDRGRELLEQRELQRVFPNLDISPEPIRKLYTGVAGTSCIWQRDTLKPIDAHVDSDGRKLTITLAKPKKGICGIAIIHNRTIIWRRDLTDEEQESGIVCESLQELANATDFRRGTEAGLYFEVASGKDKTLSPWPIRSKAKIPIYDDDALGGLLDPIQQTSDTGRKELFIPRQNSSREVVLFHAIYHVVYYGARYEYFSSFKYAIMESIRSVDEKAVVTFDMREGTFFVENVILRLRSRVEAVEIPLPYTIIHDEGWLHMEVTIDPERYDLKEIYWDMFVVVRRFGTRGFVPVKIPGMQRRMFYIANRQWRTREDKVLFPHIAKGSFLSFVFRDYYPDLDTYALRLKEFAALGTYYALLPYWKRKRVWLVFEKFCKLAQDNGYYFFDYCMSLPPEQRSHVFYVIDKSQPDFRNVKEHDANVIDFMSFKHILYSMVADIYIGSDSKAHLYTWRPKPSYVRRIISKQDIFFLQHGVTALKQVDQLFGKKGSSPMSYFLTTSEKEQDIVIKHFGYRTNQAPILGFSRWDALVDASSMENPSILLMPTWRPWLEEQDDALFVESEYFKVYSSLIVSDHLAEVLDRCNATLRFFIHPKLSERLANFKPASDRIQLVPQGSEPLNRVMMECNMLITDYSSVCWDMLYMDKPVVFYQFDQDIYQASVGSYVDLNEDLPGEVCKDEEAVIQAIDACAQRGFTLTDEQERKVEGWFAHKDTHNRQRTYNFIVEKGY